MRKIESLKDWHKNFFKFSFYNPATKATLEKAPMEVRFLLRHLKLKKGDKILDLCSGPGRHALLLARKGYSLTAYDFSADYLREAAKRARKMKVNLRTVRGDMRKLKFKNEFSAVINLFTSFGYFTKISEDLKVLNGINKALKKGGLLLMDLLNADFILKSFHPKNWLFTEKKWLLEERKLFRDGIISTWILISKRGQARKKTFFIRLYNRAKLSLMLKKAGFKPLRFWGDFRGSHLSPRSNRLIVLAQKIK